MNKFALLGGAVAVVLAAAAFAADPVSPKPARVKMAQGPMTKADVMAYSDARFAKMDRNGDGKLDVADRSESGGSGNMSDADHKKSNDDHFAAMDRDKNGSISRDEFDAAHAPGKGMDEHAGKGGKGRKGHSSRAGMHERMMKKADTNNDMSVSREEFRAAAEARFIKQDVNKDGVISADERKEGRDKMKGRGGAMDPAELMPAV